MASRSPARARAYYIWLGSDGNRPLNQIAEACNVSPGLVRKWKTIDKWTLDDKKKGDGNVTDAVTNDDGNTAIGVTNRGGNMDGNTIGNAPEPKKRKQRCPGRPGGNPNLPKIKPGDKIALTTGIDEGFLLPDLTEVERLLAADTAKLTPGEIAVRSLLIMTLREHRILERIKARSKSAEDSTSKIGGNAMRAARAVKTLAGSTHGQTTIEYQNVDALINDLENALTSVQGRKMRAIQLIHQIQHDTAMAEIELRKVAAVEEKLGMERKKLEYETNGAAQDVPADRIIEWIELTKPNTESVKALYEEDPNEKSG
jgi:uncharacterized protein YjcR